MPKMLAIIFSALLLTLLLNILFPIFQGSFGAFIVGYFLWLAISMAAFSVCWIPRTFAAERRQKRLHNEPLMLARLVHKHHNRKIIAVQEIDHFMDLGFVPISQVVKNKVVVELKGKLPDIARTYLLMLSLLLNRSSEL